MSEYKKLSNVFVIINPAAGTEYPILFQLNRALRAQKINWEGRITTSKYHALEFAKEALTKNIDAVIVYGGDGTVMEVASVLYKTEIPLIILPGGTANVFAKELVIPTDIPTALQIFSRSAELKKVDVSLCDDGSPMFLRVEAGLLADMVQNTTRAQKNSLGALAYPVTAVKEISTAVPSRYKMQLDDEFVDVEGVAMMVANVGNIGITGVSIQDKVSCFDEKLDVFVLQSADLGTLLSVGSSALVKTEKPSTLRHWQVQYAKIEIEPAQTILRDDVAVQAASFSVRMEKEKLHILL